MGLDCVILAIKSVFDDDHKGDGPMFQPWTAVPPVGFPCEAMTATPLMLSIYALPVALP